MIKEMIKDLKIWPKRLAILAFTIIMPAALSASALFMAVGIQNPRPARQAEHGNRFECITDTFRHSAGQALKHGVTQRSMPWEALPAGHSRPGEGASPDEQAAEHIFSMIVWISVGEVMLFLLSLACAAWSLSTDP